MKIGFYEIAAVLVVIAICVAAVMGNRSWKQERRSQESFERETRMIINDLQAKRHSIRQLER